MKKQIIIFITGLLLGAAIASGSFCAYNLSARKGMPENRIENGDFPQCPGGNQNSDSKSGSQQADNKSDNQADNQDSNSSAQ